MKHVSLKVVDCKDPSGKPFVLNYKTNLIGIMSLPLDPRGGIKVDEIRKSLRVLDAIANGNDDGFDIEDADFDHMCQKVKNATFQFVHQAFADFVEETCSSQST